MWSFEVPLTLWAEQVIESGVGTGLEKLRRRLQSVRHRATTPGLSGRFLRTQWFHFPAEAILWRINVKLGTYKESCALEQIFPHSFEHVQIHAADYLHTAALLLLLSVLLIKRIRLTF